MSLIEIFCVNSSLDEIRYKRVTVTRVPSIGEKIRILATIEGMTTAFILVVKSIVHNANSEEYPRRQNELDAWVTCEEMK